MDYTEIFQNELDVPEIISLRNLLEQKFSSPDFSLFREMAQKKEILQSRFVREAGGRIVIGDEHEISAHEKNCLRDELKIFSPWRKGPFSLFGIDIDAEWRSDLKWQRILPHLDSLQNKKIADVGCNNGYFLFRAALEEASLVVGFDPTYRFQQNFYYLKKHTPLKNIFFELLGFEHLHLYANFFDVLLNLGVLYHHSDPLLVLQKSYAALKKGGQIVLDSLYVETDEIKMTNINNSPSKMFCLYPGTRYAGMRNVHFIPSRDVIKEMMTRAGFHHLQEIYRGEVSISEQRATAWAEVKSLADVRDPQNLHLTTEGFPMPRRCYLVGRK